MAQRLDASVTLFHVVPAGTAPDPSICAGLNRLATEHFEGVRMAVAVEPGDPATKIIEYARDHHIQLIMMPTHGYGALRSLLLGSVTASVLAEAPCAVWTTSHLRPYEQNDDDGMLRVLCAVDREPDSARVMQWASGFSRDLHAGLHLVHAALSITDCPSLDSEQTLQETVRSSCRAAVEAIRKSAGVEAPLSVSVGDVEEVVHDEVLRQHATAVVIGLGVLNGKLGRLRTHAHAIIRRCTCPVICI
jgi:nucleotide-binding universal stress UspA family protein